MEAGARDAGRDPDALKMSMYIRVCIDDDVAAARRAFAAQVLSYALVPRGGDRALGYRALFTRMGFDQPLRALESRRDGGSSIADLVDDAPEELLSAVGYYGRPEGAAKRFAELAVGLDEVVVRVITTSPSPEKVRLAYEALSPEEIRRFG
jgi:alkanesulfonate monooxygenase SsuD/methylene tetrahydromethanopterin reductase-like flavin-dependent oxidoreductase (luciferase family)